MSRNLAERVLAGDRAVIKELVDSCWPAMRHAAGGGVADSAELRQAARAELVELAHAYDPARDGDFGVLARRRLRRLVEQILKRERRWRARHGPIEELPEERHPVAPEPAIEPPPNRRIRRALRRLPPRLRATIVRIYYQELTALEVAAQDGASPDAVERARRQALARMKRDLRGPRTMPPSC